MEKAELKKLEDIDRELEEESDAVLKLDAQKLERKSKINSLIQERSNIQTKKILLEVQRLIPKYLKVQREYYAMRDLIADVSKHDPDWYVKVGKENQDSPFWLPVIDAHLRIDRLHGFSLGGFMDALCQVSEGLKDSPYPELKRS